MLFLLYRILAKTNLQELSFDINGSEYPTHFKMKCFSNIDQVIKREKRSSKSVIQSGQIIRIFNKGKQGYLAIHERTQRAFLAARYESICHT